jgi:hypothetical protein
MPFECPPNAEIYLDQVVNRCRGYIRLGLWTIEPAALDGWLSNFVSPEEKHMAACLLDEVVFRSESQVRAMILQLLQRTLSDAMADCNQFGIDWQELLSDDQKDPAVRIVPVIRDSDSPTKSGPLVARLYRRLGGVSDKWMIWSWLISKSIRSGVKSLLLIDDFLGSGEQFIKFARRFRLHRLDSIKIIYAPLIAHPDGMSAVAKDYPKICLVPGEILSKKSIVLAQTDETFDGHNGMQSARQLYCAYWTRRGIRLSKKILYGWDELNLALAFHHGTPNATLPLFWLSGRSHKAIFSR